MIFDRLPEHISAQKFFEREYPGWFLFEYLPSYSQELNPVEQCWQNIKNVSMAILCRWGWSILGRRRVKPHKWSTRIRYSLPPSSTMQNSLSKIEIFYAQSSKRLAGGLFCDGSLAELRRVYSSRATSANKGRKFTVEGYNSRIRHYLAIFKRKTKCCSKSEEMIDISLKLLFKN